MDYAIEKLAAQEKLSFQVEINMTRWSIRIGGRKKTTAKGGLYGRARWPQSFGIFLKYRHTLRSARVLAR